MLLLFPISVLGAAAVRGGVVNIPYSMTGTYVLVDHPAGMRAPDFIIFGLHGKCTFDDGSKDGMTGVYEIGRSGTAAGLFLNTPENDEVLFSYDMVLRTHSMLLTTKDRKTTLIYVPVARVRPRLSDRSVTGAFFSYHDGMECISELTEDHQFHMICRRLDAKGRVSQDTLMAGKWRLGTDGVITYTPWGTEGAQGFVSMRDVVARRTSRGLWLIDAYDDTAEPQVPEDVLELPGGGE